MKFKLAEVSDANIIHELMIKAFMEYKDKETPSTALEETVESITADLMNNELGFIAYDDEQPVGMVRFKLLEDGLYFYRLSVLPEKQGLGIAKKILKQLEVYASMNNIPKLMCKVRGDVPRNIHLYQSIGYHITEKEIMRKPNGIQLSVVSMAKQLHV